MTAGVACGSCGTGLRENAKFCDECGAPTAVSADTAKYKQVTVLFADVVRSMDIAAALDMERLREIITELVERSAAVLRHYGGGIVEFTGDGVMAHLRRPGGVGGSRFSRLPGRAWPSRRRRTGWRPRWQCRDGVTLRVRVGLNSGRVIAGAIGSGSLGYAAIGRAGRDWRSGWNRWPLVTAIVSACAQQVEHAPKGLKLMHGPATPEQVKTVERLQRRRRDPNDRALLEQVAALYKANPDAPLAAISEALGTSPS